MMVENPYRGCRVGWGTVLLFPKEATISIIIIQILYAVGIMQFVSTYFQNTVWHDIPRIVQGGFCLFVQQVLWVAPQA